jgi:multiple sugar transport system permease protein
LNNKKYVLSKVFSKILIYLVLIIILTFAFFPIFWMISTSFKPNHEAFNVPPTWIPHSPTLESYIKQITDRAGFIVFFKNGLIVSISVTLFTIILATLSGYSFSRFRFSGQRAIFLLILATQMFPYVVIVISLYVVYKKLGLLNTYPGLIFSLTTFSLPFSIWMIKGFCDIVPKEIEEAAYVDGSSRIGILFKIVVPIISPGIVAVALFSFLVAWNNLLFSLTLSSRNNMLTIPPGFLMTYVGEFQYSWSGMCAGSTIVTIPVIIIFIFFQKYLVAGLTAGSVKG